MTNEKHTIIDDMNYDDAPNHMISMEIGLTIDCSGCNSQHPIKSYEWLEDGYHIIIRPHVCVWDDDDLEKNIDNIKEELMK